MGDTRNVWRGLVPVLLIFAAGCGSRTAAIVRDTFPATQKVNASALRHDCRRKCRVSVIRDDERIIGYAVEQVVISRSGPFEILALIDGEFRVARAEVMSYPGERGREVQNLGFRTQFEGKGPADPIRIGKDIHAVTGATISSRVMTDGVRHAVHLVRSRLAEPD
jgi:Na+-translocating ferredoxin:NAD+ oxidoreductase RnfG subunit